MATPLVPLELFYGFNPKDKVSSLVPSNTLSNLSNSNTPKVFGDQLKNKAKEQIVKVETNDLAVLIKEKKDLIAEEIRLEAEHQRKLLELQAQKLAGTISNTLSSTNPPTEQEIEAVKPDYITFYKANPGRDNGYDLFYTSRENTLPPVTKTRIAEVVLIYSPTIPIESYTSKIFYTNTKNQFEIRIYDKSGALVTTTTTTASSIGDASNNADIIAQRVSVSEYVKKNTSGTPNQVIEGDVPQDIQDQLMEGKLLAKKDPKYTIKETDTTAAKQKFSEIVKILQSRYWNSQTQSLKSGI